MEIVDGDWKKIAENKDVCFYCGSKDTITYQLGESGIMFKIECNTCDEYSYF
ncbi:MAG: hypothetical protein ACFFDN_00325 [Candidatus Hodarchaeota archaeon]